MSCGVGGGVTVVEGRNSIEKNYFVHFYQNPKGQSQKGTSECFVSKNWFPSVENLVFSKLYSLEGSFEVPNKFYLTRNFEV